MTSIGALINAVERSLSKIPNSAGAAIDNILESAISAATAVVASRLSEAAEVKIHELVQQVAGEVQYSWSTNSMVALYQKLFLTQAAIARLFVQYEIEQKYQIQLTLVSVRRLPRIVGATENSQDSVELAATDTAYLPNLTFFADLENFYSASPESVAELMEGFWCQYDDYVSTAPALEVLGLREGASWQAIKARYRELASAHHPDKGGDTQQFIAIRSAFEQLKRRHN